MTLILGIICKDGIVMATDSQMTMGIIKKTGVEKIKQCGFCLWAGAGDVSCIQTIEKNIDTLPVEVKTTGLMDNLVGIIQRMMHSQRKDYVERYVDIYKNPAQIPLCEIMVCGYNSKRQPIITIITGNGDSVEFDDYCSIGIGTPFAQVLLKTLNLNNFVKNISIDQGKVFAYKVIKAAIETGNFGMDFPIFIWEIKPKEETIEVRKLEGVEINAVEDTANWLNQIEQEVFSNVGGNNKKSGEKIEEQSGEGEKIIEDKE